MFDQPLAAFQKQAEAGNFDPARLYASYRIGTFASNLHSIEKMRGAKERKVGLCQSPFNVTKGRPMNKNLSNEQPKTSTDSLSNSLGDNSRKKLGPGNKAPEFELSDDAGAKVSLASFDGKKIVLYFYPKDDTSGCTKEAIDFNGLRGEFKKAGAAILGVSPDSVASHAKFKAKHKLDFALAADETKAILEAYGVWVEKSMYGRKYMGVERTTFLIGKDGQIATVWNKVKVPGHAEAVLAAAKAL
jgi:thioredoxin-dependent peroxiredoxin